MKHVFIGAGSNVGDRSRALTEARLKIGKLPGTRFLRSSSVIETEPVGGPPQGKFLNAVWEIETLLGAPELRDQLLGIESELGRVRTVKNAPRQIDLDILFYGDEVVCEDRLEIPHPRLHERAFVLGPLAELAPKKIHPQLKKTVQELFEGLTALR